MDHTFGEEVERKEGEQEELRNIKCVAEVWKYIKKRRGKKKWVENNIQKEEWVEHFKKLLEGTETKTEEGKRM